MHSHTIKISTFSIIDKQKLKNEIMDKKSNASNNWLQSDSLVNYLPAIIFVSSVPVNEFAIIFILSQYDIIHILHSHERGRSFYNVKSWQVHRYIEKYYK